MNNKTHNAGKQAQAIKAEAEKNRQQDNNQRFEEDRNWTLDLKNAPGGSPADVSVLGEEDAGVGLEFLVRNESLNSTARSRAGYHDASTSGSETASGKAGGDSESRKQDADGRNEK